MIDAYRDQHYRGHAVQHATQVLVHRQHGREPGVGKLQCKAGQHQNDEAGKQRRML